MHFCLPARPACHKAVWHDKFTYEDHAFFISVVNRKLFPRGAIGSSTESIVWAFKFVSRWAQRSIWQIWVGLISWWPRNEWLSRSHSKKTSKGSEQAGLLLDPQGKRKWRKPNNNWRKSAEQERPHTRSIWRQANLKAKKRKGGKKGERIKNLKAQRRRSLSYPKLKKQNLRIPRNSASWV